MGPSEPEVNWKTGSEPEVKQKWVVSGMRGIYKCRAEKFEALEILLRVDPPVCDRKIYVLS